MEKNVVIAVMAAALVWMTILAVRPPADRRDEGASRMPPATESPAPPPGTESRTEIVNRVLSEIRASPAFGPTALGFCLIDGTGEVIVDDSAGTGFIPASTLKTVTAATALEMLGADFRFETRLRAAAPVDDEGTLAGDLVIVGGGDPTLAPEDLATWVEALRDAGVSAIDGAVVGDGSFFPGTIAGDFWNWGDVGNGYGSPAAGLNLNHNRFAAHFRPGEAPGAPAEFLGPDPEVPDVEWLNRVTTGPEGSGDGVMIYGGPDASLIRLEGTVPAGVPEFMVSGAVPDPPLFAAHHLDRMLRAAGIAVAEPPRGTLAGIRPPAADGPANLRSDHDDRPAGTDLVVHHSEPLSAIVRHLLAVSDNHESECLFRLLGVRRNAPPADVIRDHWRSRGLDLSVARMVDGSGLGRANFITPGDLARLQFLARHGPLGSVYFDSLNVHFDGAVRWKGGAMSGVRAYAGFITEESSGEEFTFALMCNHYPDPSAVSRWRHELVQAVISDPG